MKRHGLRIDPISATERERGIIIHPDTWADLDKAVPVRSNTPARTCTTRTKKKTEKKSPLQ
ncbi:hypothetical protein DLE01_23525 [Streptomyces sp. FT05W]|uniref:hypothetical protein n=1 Tax=[Kitasatospora] papulosa TaxID=1464011 RepID=UPI000D7018DF|nr:MULTISPECIES: hypothetical protein [Streptomyces]PWS49370.1 hypothetical protein DLE01_23525 [Streptomyces sp. FT05W]WSI21662.1 hypothetical protein OG336_33460 [[Kitasatospora] papulosa]